MEHMSFELLHEQELPELDSYVRHFRHLRNGAEVLSLTNSDENKVFGITFRTPPSDSTGVAHILEHSVLRGSSGYPAKDPISELRKGSLKTFLNAMTYPDKTCYVIASQNNRDFYNLIQVYLDAVLFPKLTLHTFQQEGWHYQLERPDKPLVIKGVVFNEMKGRYNSPESVLAEHARRSIFPDTPYGVSSGGHPLHIPDLTYEQLLAFRHRFYTPSNARFFFYGNDHERTRLERLDYYLMAFIAGHDDSTIKLQPRFDAPRRSVYPYRVDPHTAEEKKSQIRVTWLLVEHTDPQQVIAFALLAHVLLGTAASPLRKALIDSGLGEDLVGSGFSDGTRQGYFSVGMKGIAFEDADRVEALIFETLERLAREGLDPLAIEASLNTLEFRMRENNTGSFPRGLAAMLTALTTWLHDGDPLALLAFEQPLNALKARLAEGEPLLEHMIREFLLDNLHRTTTILKPDPQFGAWEDAQEQNRLETARNAMSDKQVQELIENTYYLKQLQETPDPPEVLAKIPSLTLDDLDQRNKTIPLEVLEQQETTLLYHDLPTRGICYIDVGMNLHTLPQELLPYLSVFGKALLQVGTARENYVQLLQRIGRKTGGISTSDFSFPIQGSPESTAWFMLHGKATPEQVPEMLNIMHDILLTPQFDNQERLLQMVRESKARIETAISPSGHRFVGTRLYSNFHEAGWFAEQTGGIGYLFFLRQVIHEIEHNWPAVLERLEQIRRLLVNRSTMLCNVTIDQQNWLQCVPHLEAFLATLPAAPTTQVAWSPQYQHHNEGLTIPTQVNYVGKCVNLYEHGYQYHGSAAVITRYLASTWVRERVRVQGGAYGGLCTFNRHSGLLTFLSYRDPNLLATLHTYDQSSTFLRICDLSERELTRSIIGTISDIDAYQLPDAKGYTSMVRYLRHDTEEVRQRVRDEVLGTTVADFRAFADVLDLVKEHGRVVLIGSAAAVDQVNSKHAGMLNRVDVL